MLGILCINIIWAKKLFISVRCPSVLSLFVDGDPGPLAFELNTKTNCTPLCTVCTNNTY
ncbi:hypothetical protein M758_7G114100 [Ceratodon purpureus]|nr:hypothetical protein M758_7G114100 [Ceratodon purpureus]